jgi:1-acyl-sn-glycerol-3-phosphate acyltransferase
VGGVSAHAGAPRATTPHRRRLARFVRLAAAVARTWWRAVVAPPVPDGGAWRRLVVDSAEEMLAALAVRVEVRGAHPLTEGPVLLVANHVSWIDVQALGLLHGPRFVAKTEVRDWPLVGRMVAGLGTIFHRRGSCRDAGRVKDVLARSLVTGGRAAVFPEGTTTDGGRVGKFHAAFLQAAIDAAVPVQPVAIRYREADGTTSTAAAFVDDMSFLASLARVLARPALVVELTFGAPIYAADKTRRELAAQCHAFVASTLGFAAVPAAEPTRLALRRAA